VKIREPTQNVRIACELMETADIGVVSFEKAEETAPGGEISLTRSVSESGRQGLGRTLE
jgi:hypothetical protein